MRRIIFILGFVFLFLISYSNASNLGCCIVSNDLNDFCFSLDVDSQDSCASGMWDNRLEAILNGECSGNARGTYNGNTINNACEVGCSVIDGKGTNGRTRIGHILAGGLNDDFYTGQCRSENSEIVFCIKNGVCVSGWTREKCIDIEKGKVENVDCSNYNKDVKGCCIKSGVCSYGTAENCIGGVFDNKICSEVNDCKSRCRLMEQKCIGTNGDISESMVKGGKVIREDNCGGFTEIKQCDELEFCCIGSECDGTICKLPADCTGKLNGAKWCEGSSNPGQNYVIKQCFDGKISTFYRCDEYRNTICSEESGNAECVVNDWKNCFGNSDCGQNKFCQSINNECVPKYPPAFMFWKYQEGMSKQDFASDLFWTVNGGDVKGRYSREMCSIESSIEGCKASGDCVFSGVPKTTPSSPSSGEQIILVDNINDPNPDPSYPTIIDNNVRPKIVLTPKDSFLGLTIEIKGNIEGFSGLRERYLYYNSNSLDVNELKDAAKWNFVSSFGGGPISADWKYEDNYNNLVFSVDNVDGDFYWEVVVS